MAPEDLAAALDAFPSERRVLLLMCDLMSRHGEFDRAGLASQYGPAAPRNLTRYCAAGLIENESRPRGSRRTYYTMPRHAEIRKILGARTAKLGPDH